MSALILQLKTCMTQCKPARMSCALPKQAARRVARECPGVEVRVFSDRDIVAKRAEIEGTLRGADAFFASLLFDFDQVPHSCMSDLCFPCESVSAGCCTHATELDMTSSRHTQGM